MAGEKEVVLRFSTEGLEQISAQIQEVKNLMAGGSSTGGVSTPSGASAPVVGASGPVAPSPGASSGVSQAAASAGTPRSSLPVNPYEGRIGYNPLLGNGTSSPYAMPAVPSAPPVGVGQSQSNAAAGGISFNPINGQYNVTNTNGKTVFSSAEAGLAQAAAGLVGVSSNLPGAAIPSPTTAPRVPVQSFYQASGMNLTVGGQTVAQGIPGVATPESLYLQAQGLNQQVMSGGLPVPTPLPQGQAFSWKQFGRGLAGFPLIGAGGVYMGMKAAEGIQNVAGYLGEAAAGGLVYPEQIGISAGGAALDLGALASFGWAAQAGGPVAWGVTAAAVGLSTAYNAIAPPIAKRMGEIERMAAIRDARGSTYGFDPGSSWAVKNNAQNWWKVNPEAHGATDEQRKAAALMMQAGVYNKNSLDYLMTQYPREVWEDVSATMVQQSLAPENLMRTGTLSGALDTRGQRFALQRLALSDPSNLALAGLPHLQSVGIQFQGLTGVTIPQQQSTYQIASAQMQMTGQFQGAAAYQSQLPAVQQDAEALAKSLDLAAQMTKGLDESKRAELLTAANAIRMQSKQQQYTGFQLQGAQNTAQYGAASTIGQIGILTAQFKGTPAGELPFGKVSSAMGEYMGEMRTLRQERRKAGMWTPTDEYQYQGQLAQLKYEQQYGLKRQQMGLEITEIEAQSNLAIGHAGRAMSKALYSGTEPEKLPWQEQSSAYAKEAERLQNELTKRGKVMTNAERANLTNQIAQLRYQATTGVEVERQNQVWNYAESQRSTYMTQTHAANVQLSMLGGPEERYEAAKRDIEATQMLLDLEKQRLANQSTLTALQKEEIKNKIAGLEAEQKTATIMAARQHASDVYSVSMSQIGGERAKVSQQYALGVGGQASTALIQKNLQNIRSEMGALETRMNDPSTDAITKEALKTQIEQKRTELYQAQGEAGSIPLSATQRIALSNTQTQLNLATTTFATNADIRGLLQGQMKQIGTRISDLNANRAALMARGQWTPESEARYTEERNSWVQQAAGTQHQLEEGWLDRLVSRTWNEPSNFNLISTQFTRREASLFAGITTRAFGGNVNQSDYWRRQYPAQYASMLGKTGTQEGFMETAMTKGGALGGTTTSKLEIVLHVEDSHGRSRPQNAHLQLSSDTSSFARMDATIKSPQGKYQ